MAFERRWRPQAAPDDPSAWYDLKNLWPTKRGTYETADFSTGTSISTANATAVIYAYVGRTLSGTREFLVTRDGGSGDRILEYSAGAFTDRTNGVSIGLPGGPMMEMYGNVVLCVMGVGTATVVSTSTTFSALAGAPQGEIVVVCRNAVLILNTDTSVDGWAASDVGDYTNWSTGEAASGRLIDTPGPIIAARVWGDAVYAFKSSSIYRGTYVGGVVKWRWELVWNGIGVANNSTTTYGATKGKYQCVATREGLAFNAETTADANSVYLFDGASAPYCINPETPLNEGASVFLYHPIEDVLILAPAYGSDANGTYRFNNTVSPSASLYYYYCFPFKAWGNGSGSEEEDWELAGNPALISNGVLQGDYYARAETSIKPVYYRYRNVTTGAIYRCAPSAPGSTATCYAQTTKMGLVDAKTLFDQLVPILRRRTDLGTDSAVATITFFREMEDTSAASTLSSVAESPYRKRFDFTRSDNFARFRVDWTAIDIELDNFKLAGKPAGKN